MTHELYNITATTSFFWRCLYREKFTSNRNVEGPDDSFSLEPEALAELCKPTILWVNWIAEENLVSKATLLMQCIRYL